MHSNYPMILLLLMRNGKF